MLISCKEWTTEDLSGLLMYGLPIDTYANDYRIFLGFEDDVVKSFMILRTETQNSIEPVFAFPYVMYFTNWGGPELKELMLNKIAELMPTFICENASTTFSDEDYVQSFSAAGKFQKIGTIFKVTQEE